MGLVGCAILISLGIWQVQRMTWKAAILARIEATIGADPVALPGVADPVADAYLPVTLTGELTGPQARVLVAVADRGAGYRIIARLESGGRAVLIDLGFVAVDAPETLREVTDLTVTGNLHWPNEVDGWTPVPDLTQGLWFARDIPAIAAALNTEPVLIVARTLSVDLGTEPLPINTATIPNDHRNYAITWFLLALVWAAMSGYLIYRSAKGPRTV